MENKRLFDAREDEGLHNNRYHVAGDGCIFGDPAKGVPMPQLKRTINIR
jgi:hypothetical protein